MHDTPELPPRPDPPRHIGALATAWLAWFGIGRLVATACCVLIVGAGGYWLVRSPAPATEAGLPFAGSTVAAPPASTLPVPATTIAVVADPVGGRAGGPVVVHVAGAVRGPGVYQLTGDARVHTAIDAAGGATGEADLDGLNLAAPVADGQRIYVPVDGEVDPTGVPSSPVPPAGSADSVPSGPIDINVATAADFETLPGVGPATAAAIVDDRERRGPFAAVDDLDRVPGIGPAKLAALRDLVTA